MQTQPSESVAALDRNERAHLLKISPLPQLFKMKQTVTKKCYDQKDLFPVRTERAPVKSSILELG